jgi:type III secretory pathway component EscU
MTTRPRKNSDKLGLPLVKETRPISIYILQFVELCRRTTARLINVESCPSACLIIYAGCLQATILQVLEVQVAFAFKGFDFEQSAILKHMKMPTHSLRMDESSWRGGATNHVSANRRARPRSTRDFLWQADGHSVLGACGLW